MSGTYRGEGIHLPIFPLLGFVAIEFPPDVNNLTAKFSYECAGTFLHAAVALAIAGAMVHAARISLAGI
jgi:hypothetical protein